MRLLVCGPRDCSSPTLVSDWMDAINGYIQRIAVVIEGGARGVDRSAYWWGKKHNVQILEFPAEWEKYGKGAGALRNQQMLDEGFPDRVLAFQPVGRRTPGTSDMIRKAEKAGIPVTIVYYNE